MTYEGDGIYFLDKVRPGLWRLEVYPDAEPVRDPFELPNADKIVTRAISRSWPMTVGLAGSRPNFHGAVAHRRQPAERTRDRRSIRRQAGCLRPELGRSGRHVATFRRAWASWASPSITRRRAIRCRRRFAERA